MYNPSARVEEARGRARGHFFLRASSPQCEGRPRTEEVCFQRGRCNLRLSRTDVVCYLQLSLSGETCRDTFGRSRLDRVELAQVLAYLSDAPVPAPAPMPRVFRTTSGL